MTINNNDIGNVLSLCVIRDDVAKTWLPPFLVPRVELARRYIFDSVSKEPSLPLFQHADDFSVYLAGTFAPDNDDEPLASKFKPEFLFCVGDCIAEEMKKQKNFRERCGVEDKKEDGGSDDEQK